MARERARGDGVVSGRGSKEVLDWNRGKDVLRKQTV